VKQNQNLWSRYASSFEMMAVFSSPEKGEKYIVARFGFI
jgi:hypothetical protein